MQMSFIKLTKLKLKRKVERDHRAFTIQYVIIVLQKSKKKRREQNVLKFKIITMNS